MELHSFHPDENARDADNRLNKESNSESRPKKPANTRGADNYFLNKESNSDSKTQKPAVRIFQRYADKCTMHGPSHMHGAKTWYSRVAWILIFLIALGLMCYYIVSVSQLYLSYPVKQTVSVSFSSLQFPAVTICNVNPVRASMLNELSADLGKFLNHTDPGNIGGIIDNASVDSTSHLGDIDFGYSSASEHVDDHVHDGLAGYTDSWEGEAKTSSVSQMERDFQEMYAAESRDSRVKAGYQLKDMLMSCSFAGKSCYAENFTLTTSTTFGNCYTLEYSKFVAKSSGPKGGLELMLFLDTEESIRAITPDDGLQVSIQPQVTVPFPVEKGMAVDAGSHTGVSMNLIQIERKGQPYGECAEDNDYLKKYQVRYSRQTCNKVCEQEEVHRSCQCLDETAEDINRLMSKTRHRPCRTKQDMVCLARARWRYQNGDVQCSCPNPCAESRYGKVMTSRSWPHKDYAGNVLVKMVCKRVSADKCQRLKAKASSEVKQEFLKLNIFYEDLMYESVIEEEDYGVEKFIADIGGNFALWLGLSLVSIMELLQLGLEVGRHLCCCRWRD